MATHILHRTIDDPGPDYGPIAFRDVMPGVTHVYLGQNQIGHIVKSSWLRTTIYKITIHLGTRARKATASTLPQAKVFAMQEVSEFFARTPMRFEVIHP